MIPIQKIIQLGWQITSNGLSGVEIQWKNHTFHITERNVFFALTVNDHVVNIGLSHACGSKIPPSCYILSGQENLLMALKQCQTIINEKERRSEKSITCNEKTKDRTSSGNKQQRLNDLQKDLDKLRQELESIKETEREAFFKQRNGQQKLREFLMISEGACCIVTGISVPEALRASHITAWGRDPVNRLTPENVLLLAAHLDALFDKHLISFDPDDGHMLISGTISPADRAALGLSEELRIPISGKRSEFLRQHMQIFLKKNKDEAEL